LNATPHPPEVILRTPGPESNLCVRMPTAFALAVLAHCLSYCRFRAKTLNDSEFVEEAKKKKWPEIQFSSGARFRSDEVADRPPEVIDWLKKLLGKLRFLRSRRST